jgi:hypothetical protein
VKLRGLLTPLAVGLVLVVAAFALADALRDLGRPGQPSARTRAQTTTSETETVPPDTGPAPRPEAPEGWPQGELDGVLTFVGAEDCRIRVIGLAGGRERPVTRLVTNCRGFWAPEVGADVAYGVVFREEYFRIADLGDPQRNLGEYPMSPETRPLWSPDGRRLAWCDSPGSGAEREIVAQGRILPFCPLAYTPGGALAHAEGDRLVVGGRTVLTAPGTITFAQFGVDGSIAVVVDDGTLYRYAPGEPTLTAQISRLEPAGPPVLSPDTCTAALPTDAGIYVYSLSCSPTGDRLIAGHAAAWSPDGAWLAVAGPNGIVFTEIASSRTLSWPATAVELAWRTD